MRAGGENGAHIETLILGYPSNPSNFIDIPEEKTEIKSCQEYYKGYPSKKFPNILRRAGQFKINREQHKYLLEIDGYYLFVVQDGSLGAILLRYKIKASTVEEYFRILDRPLTKHHYNSINWKKVFKLN